ncbi:hypothetical protein BHU72_13555 [Desulfuribacillus stibiiarsenatis]|uniref:DUF2185 domain-containing protein n=1 Tax=Desulfuribacillus stibiiarsenatis TaxID=1390249 RepID=A0A1E5L8W9_9FIRM|nr:hypothetical protein [Desulfuribacillus stibiiarsenatis]OEH86439.1 hypothetical protein BHU72_13555 [Desulfuribacillus stibiiarsenatis]
MFGKKKVFEDLPNTMVLTTKEVIANKRGILFVSHDADDGMWQFHCGTDVDMEDAMMVALEEIIDFDPAITAIADLPLGWVAWREDITSPWKREEAN